VKKLAFLIPPFLLLPSHALAKTFGDFEGAVYVRNYDGDTVTFNLPGLHPIIGEKINIRVNGIDTPEIRGKCDQEKYNAKQAKEMVTDILQDQRLLYQQRTNRKHKQVESVSTANH